MINGLVQPDRRPNPHYWNVKAVYQWVKTEAVDAEAGRLRIRNRYQFRDLSHLALEWSVREDGRVLASGQAPMPAVAPGAAEEVRLPLPALERASGAEYVLEVRYVRREADALLPAGHEEAFAQFPLTFRAAPSAPLEGAAVTVEERERAFVLGSGDVRVEVDRRSGLVTSYRVGDRELLEAPLAPDFWRAPTDNDFGGGYQMKLRAWREAGAGLRATRVTAASDPAGASVTVEGTLPVGSARLTLRYRLLPGGVLEVNEALTPGEGATAPDLMRFGMRTVLPSRYGRTEWYGRGLEESYQDRTSGARLGRWSLDVAEWAHPYVRPQETGNRTGVRWLALRDEEGWGLLVAGAPEVEATAIPYAREDLDPGERKVNAHWGELRARDAIYLNVDFKQRGVGGIDSWGAAPLPQYSMPFGAYGHTFRLRPLRPGEAAEAVARTLRAKPVS
jgi:beta-galactosidase